MRLQKEEQIDNKQKFSRISSENAFEAAQTYFGT